MWMRVRVVRGCVYVRGASQWPGTEEWWKRSSGGSIRCANGRAEQLPTQQRWRGTSRWCHRDEVWPLMLVAEMPMAVERSFSQLMKS